MKNYAKLKKRTVFGFIKISDVKYIDNFKKIHAKLLPVYNTNINI
jgi:hypothetical protein